MSLMNWTKYQGAGFDATAHVIASNAPAAIMRAAQSQKANHPIYIAPGSADGVGIASLINSLDKGASIRFSEGDFSVDAVISVNVQGLNFYGTGFGFGATSPGIVGTVFHGTPTLAGTGTPYIFNVPNATDIFSSWEGIGFTGTGCTGLYLQVRDCRVNRCTFNVLSTGVYSTKGDVWVNQCEIEACSVYGCNILEDSNWITSNVLWANGTDIRIGANAENTVVSGNRTYQSELFLLLAASNDNLSIFNNRIDASTVAAIQMSNSVVITGSQVSHNLLRGGGITPFWIKFGTSNSCPNTHIDSNILRDLATSVFSGTIPTNLRGKDNDGYIFPGERRTYSFPISTLTENAYNSVDNPFGQTVALIREDIYVSTGATGGLTPNLDCGIGSSATTDYTTLFNDLPGETEGVYASVVATPGTQTQPQLWESGSGNRYLNHSIKDAAATGMVATGNVEVMGQ